MREYILYVILIFCPIGAGMLFFLQKEGLQRKNIFLIILSSLLMIIFFPIIMQRLGTYVSVIIYLLLIVFLVVYFLKPDKEPHLQAESVMRNIPEFRQAILEQERDVILSAGDSVQAAAEDDSIDYSDEDEENINGSQTEEINKSDLKENTPDDVDNEQKKVQEAREALLSLDQDVLEDKNNKETEANVLEEDNEHQNVKEIAESLDDVPEQESEIKDNEKETECEEKIDGFPLNEIPDEELEKPLAFESNTIESNLDIEKENAEVEEDVVEELEEEPENQNIEKDEEVSDEPAKFSNSKLLVDNENINDLIDKGFYYKFANNIEEMIRCFQEALQKTNDYELKYLLTMELVNVYKNMGLYKEAEEILQQFLSLGMGRPDIMKGINDELLYLSLLTWEMDRLGIMGTPVSEIPRWVKLKVTEEMNLLRY